jgi:hypothetical protein
MSRPRPTRGYRVKRKKIITGMYQVRSFLLPTQPNFLSKRGGEGGDVSDLNNSNNRKFNVFLIIYLCIRL